MNRFTSLFIFLSLAIPTLLRAQAVQLHRYTTANGLPQSNITSLLADSYGYIWAGTSSAGLARFDGIHFENFSSQHGLPDERIRALHQDRHGGIWIGTASGLAYFDGRQFTIIEGSKSKINVISETASGSLWVGSEQGLLYVEKGQLQYEPQLGRIPIYDLQSSSNDDLWIGTDKGLYRYRKDKLSLYGSSKGASGTRVRSITMASNDSLYVAYQNGQVDLFSQQTFTPQRLSFPFSPIIQSLHSSTADRLWICTADQGLQLWSPKKQILSRPSSLTNKLFNNTPTITTDLWGQHWIGTTNGLLRYTDQPYSPFGQIPELARQNILSLYPSQQERLWIGTNRGVFSLQNNQVKTHTEFSTLTPLALFQDQRQRFWIGTENRGLAMYDDRAFYFVGGQDELGSNKITDIVQDKKGYLWAATANAGICRLDTFPGDSTGTRFIFQQFSKKNGLGSNQIYQLFFDDQQRLWYAGNEGIGYLQGDSSWINFSSVDGLPSAPVRSLAMDNNGYLWGGTAGAGIFRCRLHQGYISVKNYTQDQGLSSNNIYQIHFDQKGQLWLGHQSGVDRITLDFYDVIDDVQNFGVTDGFTGIETTLNTIWENSQGQLLFGTTNGLMRFTPGSDLQNKIPPPIQLEQVRLFYEPLEKTKFSKWTNPYTGLGTGLSLPYNQNHLSFEFKAVNQVAPEKVQYQFQLLGADPKWSPLTKQQQATYPNLAPGKYTFQVRSVNEDGVISAEPLQVTFSIEPALWQRWWFRWGLGLLVLGLIVLITQNRIRRIREKATAEKAQLEAEKQLLSLEQKALQLQMNPHFIFNALGSIQHLIGQQDHRAARYQLAKFSKLMRSILEYSREDRISLANEIELLENYLSLEQFTRNQAFQFEFSVEEDLDPETTYLPPMMIQPFLENAVIHGIAHVEKGLITVNFKRKFNVLICTIRDNGIGRQRAAKRKSQQGEQHKSVALTVTRERLAALSPGNQRLGLDIEDLVQGTRVVIRLPVL